MAGTVARVTEISAKSDTSFEDAINMAVSRASQTLRGVTAAWVKEQNVDIEDGRMVRGESNGTAGPYPRP